MRPRIKTIVENGNVSVMSKCSTGPWTDYGVKCGSSSLTRKEFAIMKAKQIPCNRRRYDYAQNMANQLVQTMFAKCS